MFFSQSSSKCFATPTLQAWESYNMKRGCFLATCRSSLSMLTHGTWDFCTFSPPLSTSALISQNNWKHLGWCAVPLIVLRFLSSLGRPEATLSLPWAEPTGCCKHCLGFLQPANLRRQLICLHLNLRLHTKCICFTFIKAFNVKKLFKLIKITLRTFEDFYYHSVKIFA